MSERVPVKRVNKDEKPEFKASASFIEPSQPAAIVEAQESVLRAIKEYQRADGTRDTLKSIAIGNQKAPVIEFTARTRHSDQPMRLAIDTILLSEEDLATLVNVLLKATEESYQRALRALRDSGQHLALLALDDGTE